jgi:hypothetical protein
MRKNFREVKERDERWLMRVDFAKVGRVLVILLAVFILLNLIDIVTTLAALSNKSLFVELNPIAFGLFQLRFPGFVLALVFKLVPLVPLTYGVFVSDSGKNPVQLRTVKLGVLVALGAADILYVVIVLSNVGTLMAGLG